MKQIDIIQHVGAAVRHVRDAEHDGKPAKVVAASRTYSTSADDLWNALTDPERLQRWFGPVTGDFRLGGRYELKKEGAKVSGSVTECQPPKSLALTWEHYGTSWVTVKLVPESSERTRLELEHKWKTVPRWVQRLLPEKVWDPFGPGAGGVGWDLTLFGLDEYLRDGRFEQKSWSATAEGKDFLRRCAEDWGRADVAAGADAARSAAKVQRTIKFYTSGKSH
jgi:uncharacterized protein YndB with AHSA1/START domain